MSDMNKTPSSNRVHIAIFGRRNVGKSSLINALTNQNLAIVSNYAGTTTDPVYKAMEILPLGPVVIIDTAGIDDVGAIGEQRVQKTMEVINRTDLALVVIGEDAPGEFEEKIIEILKKKSIKFIVVFNKSDISENFKNFSEKYISAGVPVVSISASEKTNIDTLKNLMVSNSPKEFEQPSIVGDLLTPGDTVILVIPIDTGMPKGRLILPQVQTMRDILDSDCMFYAVKERELKSALDNLVEKPKLVITDSQAFSKVSADTPDDILLTSFSILFARQKGDLFKLVEGAKTLKNLKNGSKILVAEACTHHQQSDDIGRVKLPRWIREHIADDISFEFCSGREYPSVLSKYNLILHCGGCMINRKEMLSRIEVSEEHNVPIINYGVAIALIHGILDRALKPFPEVYHYWMEENN